MSSRNFIGIVVFALYTGAALSASPSVRIKDIAQVQGVRENQLLGLGLVTGLAGKGDSSGSPLLQSALTSLVSNFGMQVQGEEIKSKNCAVVMVNADIPPFIRSGDRINVTVSSIADARSLEGGILLQTPLKGANGKIYAVAQGSVVTPRRGGTAGASGSIPSGAIVEREVLSTFLAEGRISLLLRHPDFVTAETVRKTIQEKYPQIEVRTTDAALVEVRIPADRVNQPIGFIAELQSLEVKPDASGKVVIDASSGVIIFGEKVRIGKVAVAYQAVQVSVGEDAGLGTGFGGNQDTKDQFVLEDTATVNDLVTTLQQVGMKTEAIIGILTAIDRAGALYGELIIM